MQSTIDCCCDEITVAAVEIDGQEHSDSTEHPITPNDDVPEPGIYENCVLTRAAAFGTLSRKNALRRTTRSGGAADHREGKTGVTRGTRRSFPDSTAITQCDGDEKKLDIRSIWNNRNCEAQLDCDLNAVNTAAGERAYIN